LVAFGNLCIVAQDWEFPDFSESPNVSIMAVNFSSFTVTLPTWLRDFLETYVLCCFHWKVPVGLYISGKWFSYFGIVFGLAFDWAYWFMTALCFRTCDYAQVRYKEREKERRTAAGNSINSNYMFEPFLSITVR
jgi:hypothetical protein